MADAPDVDVASARSAVDLVVGPVGRVADQVGAVVDPAARAGRPGGSRRESGSGYRTAYCGPAAGTQEACGTPGGLVVAVGCARCYNGAWSV